MLKATEQSNAKRSGYAPVNGLNMYYEIEGTGDPLVYIPPAFGFAGLKSLVDLAQCHSVITVDLQGHGRTPDIPERPLSIQQHANDAVGMLKYLGIPKDDFFGESDGGATATLIAVRYPDLVGRVATCGATFGPSQAAFNPEMLCFDHPPTPDCRGIQFQKESFKKVAPDPDYWPRIWGKMVSIQWEGFFERRVSFNQSAGSHCRGILTGGTGRLYQSY